MDGVDLAVWALIALLAVVVLAIAAIVISVPFTLISNLVSWITESRDQKQYIRATMQREQREKEQKERTEGALRANAIRDNRILEGRFSGLYRTCAAPWRELTSVMSALKATDLPPFRTLLNSDIRQVLLAFLRAIDAPEAKASIQGMWYVLFNLEADRSYGWDESANSLFSGEPKPVCLPFVVDTLSRYEQIVGKMDEHRNAPAEAFCYLVIATAAVCPSSPAVEILREQYLHLLRPFLVVRKECGICQKSFSLLRLSSDATKEQISEAHRHFSLFYHPDKYEGQNEQLRRLAQEQQKEINAAYSHIMSHFSGPERSPTN